MKVALSDPERALSTLLDPLPLALRLDEVSNIQEEELGRIGFVSGPGNV